jgi:hypothetical protein
VHCKNNNTKVYLAKKELTYLGLNRKRLKKSVMYYKGKHWSLRASLKSYELRQKKTKNKQNILIQKQHIRNEKLTYVETIKHCRDESRLLCI